MPQPHLRNQLHRGESEICFRADHGGSHLLMFWKKSETGDPDKPFNVEFVGGVLNGQKFLFHGSHDLAGWHELSTNEKMRWHRVKNPIWQKIEGLYIGDEDDT